MDVRIHGHPMRKQLKNDELGIGNGYENMLYYSIPESHKRKVLWVDRLDDMMFLRQESVLVGNTIYA
jgi:hypothetical protein